LLTVPDFPIFAGQRDDICYGKHLFGGHIVILATAEEYSPDVVPRKRAMPAMTVTASQTPRARSKVALSGAMMDCPRNACHVRIPTKLR